MSNSDRGTGRTERELKRALGYALQGKHVIVFGANREHCSTLAKRMASIASLSLDYVFIEKDKCLLPGGAEIRFEVYSVDNHKRLSVGSADGTIFLYDHYTLEVK